MSEEMAQESPRQHWQVGSYRFSRYTRKQIPGKHPWRWECSKDGRGSCGRWPWTVFRNLREWIKEPARPL
jgi:hypothetical protein